MTFRAAALTVLLISPPIQLVAQSKELRIGVDRRVELMAIIFRLAGNEEFQRTYLPAYSADIDTFFAPQRNHEAVTLARGLRERYGLGQSRVMAIAMRLTDPPRSRSACRSTRLRNGRRREPKCVASWRRLNYSR